MGMRMGMAMAMAMGTSAAVPTPVLRLRMPTHARPAVQMEAATLDSGTAVGFLCTASFFLLALYALLRAGYNIVLLLLNILFVLATSTAVSTLVAIDAVAAALPRRLADASVYVPCCADLDQPLRASRLPLPHLLGGACALSLSLSWFAIRHDPWAWLLQDGLSVCICVLFVRTIRLPSLRIASLFLGLMFAYDIFMVFISPLLFHTSVMMAVATAGEPTAAVAASGRCVRTDGETMPMLMQIPRLAPRRHGGGLGAGSTGATDAAAETSLVSSLVTRLSGADGDFAMIGLRRDETQMSLEGDPCRAEAISRGPARRAVFPCLLPMSLPPVSESAAISPCISPYRNLPPSAAVRGRRRPPPCIDHPSPSITIHHHPSPSITIHHHPSRPIEWLPAHGRSRGHRAAGPRHRLCTARRPRQAHRWLACPAAPSYPSSTP